MQSVIIEPHYAGCLEYYCLMMQYEQVIFEIHESFQKQTYRNRARVLGSNKPLNLIVPVKYHHQTPLKEVIVDHSQRWIKDHWGAIYSSYGKAPFFDFFAEDFQQIWNRRQTYLLDLQMDLIGLINKLVQFSMKIDFTNSFEKKVSPPADDYRNTIQPKIDFSSRNIYRPIAYTQLFGDSFVPNLSIADLIMCEGPRAGELLKQSARL